MRVWVLWVLSEYIEVTKELLGLGFLPLGLLHIHGGDKGIIGCLQGLELAEEYMVETLT